MKVEHRERQQRQRYDSNTTRAELRLSDPSLPKLVEATMASHSPSL